MARTFRKRKPSPRVVIRLEDMLDCAAETRLGSDSKTLSPLRE